MAAPPRYAELRCRSCYSFLEGASHPEELVAQAADLGLSALALGDADGLYGVVKGWTEAKKRSFPLIVGAELAVEELVRGRTGRVVLLAQDREGYAHLCRLLTLAHAGEGWSGGGAPPVRRPREEVAVSLRALGDLSGGLFALHAGADEGAVARLRERFGRRLALAVARHRVAGEEVRIAATRSLGARLGIPVAVTNDVHTHERRRQVLQDLLTCVRHGVTVEKAGRRLFPNAERTLKGPEEMARLWSDYPEGLEVAASIADGCLFRLDEIRGEHPLPPLVAATAPGPEVAVQERGLQESGPAPEPGLAGMALLRQLCRDGARWRFAGEPPEDVTRQIAKELDLVESLGYSSYFLAVWDIVRFARGRGILCQGRGSAANSAVCFVLGITAIDPVRMGLLFERFISAERGEPPDIDVDFEHERREEVLQYVYERYGREHAGMVCEVITYRTRSAIRDAGKALGLSAAQVGRLAKLVGSHEDLSALGADLAALAGLDAGESPRVRQALELARELAGFPRHLSIHVGGFVVTRRPLCETVPVEPAAMEGRTIVQWDKDDLAALDLLKVDLLALGMLTALSRSLKLVAAHRPAPDLPTPRPWPDGLAAIPAEDPAVYAMLQRADSVGVFQVESRAQMGLAPRLKPRCFYDLVISVAIIRPGPIQGGMVHPYLRRRDGLEEVRYPSPALAAVLERTLGIPLFQEQAMRLAVVAAGFTPGEADELRRDMTHRRSHEKLAALKARLVAGMDARGIPREDSERIYQQLLGFSGYGFPESHAASFALLVYASAWVKRYHPAAFTCALLDSQPMGFYSPHTLVEDARRHGVEVRPSDVQWSEWESTLEGGRDGSRAPPGERPAVRVGLHQVRGLPRALGEGIVAARRAGPFRSLADLADRAALSRAWLARLAEAGALGSLEPERRGAIWRTLALAGGGPGKAGKGEGPGSERDLFAGLAPPEPEVTLPAASAAEEIAADYATTGLSTRGHPMAVLRPALAGGTVRTARELSRLGDRERVEVAGLVIVRQRPETAKGIVFVSLEDETGIANLVVMPDVYERYRALVRGSPFLLVRGRMERSGMVVNVRAESFAPLALAPSGAGARSHDFH
jgi:error-prone DNA polymerase